MKNLLIGVGLLAVIFFIGAIWINSKGARQKPIETMKALVWFCLVTAVGGSGAATYLPIWAVRK